jgi:hypothetical protein
MLDKPQEFAGEGESEAGNALCVTDLLAIFSSSGLLYC